MQAKDAEFQEKTLDAAGAVVCLVRERGGGGGGGTTSMPVQEAVLLLSPSGSAQHMKVGITASSV